MPEQDYSNRSAGTDPEDESLTRPANFGATQRSRFNTNRAAGFGGGTRLEGGNLSFERGEGLRGIRTQRTTDAATGEAQARYDSLVASDAAARKQQAIEDAKPNRTEEFIGGTAEVVENAGRILRDDVEKPIRENIVEPVAEGLGEIDKGVRNVGRSFESGAGNIGGQIADAGGTVICTQLMTQGLLSRVAWYSSGLHAQHLPQCVMRGYRVWSIPYVYLMRRSVIASYLVKDIVRWRAEEVAYQIGTRERGNFKGKIVRLLFEPVCAIIGLFCPDQDYMKLYATKEG